MNNSFRPITNEDLVRKYNLDELKVDRKRISALNSGLVKTDGILYDFVEQTTKDIEDIHDQLDGNITSWFYNYDPTLNNEPAVNWTTTQLKDDHLGDLFYNTDEGTAFRFIVDNGVYKWNQLTDDAAAQALSIARQAKDTADSKRRVFVVQPTPPYDVGDVWWNTSNNEMYRCIVAEDEEGSFHSTDWINDLKYTDDSTAIRLNEDLRADVVEDYATKVELTQSANSINLAVNALRVVTDMKHKIFDTLPTPPYAVGDYYIDKTNGEVYDCVNAKEEGESYASTDWVIDMDLTEYVSHAGVDIFEESINMEVSKKVDDNEIISKINMTPEQIQINSGKISLAGKTIQMTSDNIAINSTNFQVDKNGNVTCNNLNASNANVSGTINASAGVIGGCNIENNKLIIKDANIDTLNGISANKIIGGILNGNNNITIKNISGSNITGGTINGNNVTIKNLSASNISGGSLSAGQINYQYYADGQCFFRVGPGFANNPYVSALNVAYGHGGISFRNSDSAGSLGSQQAYIRTTSSGSALYISCNNGTNIEGVKFYDAYMHSGTVQIGEHYINCSWGGQIDMHTTSGDNLVMYASKKIRAGGNSSSNNVATSSSGPSSRNVKKNLKDIKADYKNVYEDLKDINMYTYDYKYKGIKDNPSDYGFIIDEIEDTKTLSKYFRNYDTKLYLDHNEVVNQSRSDEDMEQYKSIDIKEWERDAYIKGLFITIKALQNEIEELKEEVKDLKEGRDA